MKAYWWLILLAFASCNTLDKYPAFETIDSDFSKGRLNNKQIITINDLEKFHGHLCDSLVIGALAMQEAMKKLYPNQPVDRTNYESQANHHLAYLMLPFT
jgi:acetolactate decarboxylase